MSVAGNALCKKFLFDAPAKMRLMSEERTRELPGQSSFEERVFARFDALDARFNAMEARFDARFNAVEKRLDAIEERLDKVETRLDKVEVRLDRIEVRVQALEAKALDTKPIWERALAEIFEVKAGVEDLNRKFDVLTLDVMKVRADQRRVEKRMDELELRLQ